MLASTEQMWELRSSLVQFRSFEPRGLFAPVCMAHFLWGIFKWLLMAVKRNAESRQQRACGSQRGRGQLQGLPTPEPCPKAGLCPAGDLEGQGEL